MGTICLEYLNKADAPQVLPELFALLYENMEPIAPRKGSFRQQQAVFLSQVGPALQKEQRQILLCRENERIIGYLQYYVNQEKLMVEELQIARCWQRTNVFGAFFRFLGRMLPQEVQTLEAYADKRNARSRALMERLGMEVVAEDGPFLLYRGQVPDLWRRNMDKPYHE